MPPVFGEGWDRIGIEEVKGCELLRGKEGGQITFASVPYSWIQGL